MKTTIRTSSNPLENLLPKYGDPRANTPIWNESQQMFITEQYTSAQGNTYYLGVRFSDRFVTILHVGLYHSWTYINDVDVYAFDGTERVLIGKTKLDQFYDEGLIRTTVENMIRDYLSSQLKLNGTAMTDASLDTQVKELVQGSYRSMNDESDIVKKLDAVKPLLVAGK